MSDANETDATAIKLQLEIQKLRQEISSKQWSKVVAIIVVIVTIPYFIPKGYVEYRNVCISNAKYAKETISLGGISKNEIVAFVEDSVVYCGFVFPQLRAALASSVAETQPAPPKIEPSPPDSGGKTPSSTAQSTIVGWVAIGFVSGERSFELPGKKKPGDLSAGDVVVAKVPVNIRRGAADWGRPLAVADTGQKFTVKNIKSLRAGEDQQIWAEVEPLAK